MRWVACLLLLLTLAPAVAAQPGVRVNVTRAAGDEWLVDYSFDYRSPLWIFPRSAVDLAGKPWRPQSWTIETPGVRLERVGRYDVLAGNGRALNRVRIRMRLFAQPLSADYTPALRFSDGGLALYTDHFAVSPMPSRAGIAALPADLEGLPIAQPPVRLTFADPGRRLLVKGRALRGQASLGIVGDDTYIYDGDAAVIETDAFAGVIDPGLPAWLRGELDGLTPRLMRLYADRLGAPAEGRPMALVAWQGDAAPGWSLGGSVLAGMVVMQISGKVVTEAGPDVLEKARWFLGHESAHFWMGQTVRYDRRSEAWIIEGAADLLAIRAQQALIPGHDPLPDLQRELDECLTLNGPGEPLSTAEDRGEQRAYYGCGAMLYLAAEVAARRRDARADVFSFVRGLIDANRASRRVDAEKWLAAFEAEAGTSAAGRVRGLLARGSTDPRGFWQELFALCGVPVTREGDALRLGS